MYNLLLLLASAAVVFVTWGLLVFRLAGGGTTDAYGMCAPARYEPLTARPADAPRRIIAELAPPAGWRDVHIAVVPAPAAVAYDDPDELDEWGDEEPEELPLAVPSWPTRQPVEQPAVVEPDPVPVVVSRTAARFASLEVRR